MVAGVRPIVCVRTTNELLLTLIERLKLTLTMSGLMSNAGGLITVSKCIGGAFKILIALKSAIPMIFWRTLIEGSHIECSKTTSGLWLTLTVRLNLNRRNALFLLEKAF